VFRTEIKVMLKAGVLDPQGVAVQGSLLTLGYGNVGAVRVGKLIQLELDAPDQAGAERQVDEMCRRLLANPVIESYTFTVTAADGSCTAARASAADGAPAVRPEVEG